jgi:hypothetical protein
VRRGRRAVSPIAAAAALLVTAAPAGAATFTPTRHDDPVPGKCKPGDCSFREALIAANATLNKRDTILLEQGTYELELPPGAPLKSGQFSIYAPVTVRGQGAGATRIDGNDVDRVIAIRQGTPGLGTVKLQSLRIKGGDAGANLAHNSEGGGIYAAGDTGSKLSLRNVVVQGNEAQFGGGIFAYNQEVTIKNSTLRLNTADEGGGLHVIAAPAATDVAIRASTISSNIANHKGAGILADGSSFWGPEEPTVQLLNSTVAGNTAVDLTGDVGTREGGGIMVDNAAAVTLDNTTVAHNRAGDVVEEGIGGGIYQHSGGVLNWGDTLVALNFVGHLGSVTANHPGAECAGSLAGLDDGNLIKFQSGTACSFTGTSPTGINNANIGNLADNGGPTETVALLSGSGAIGRAASCPKKDQRGKPRPTIDCDTGAFERKGP